MTEAGSGGVEGGASYGRRWGQVRGSQPLATQAALDGHRESLTSPEFRTTVHALAGLYPANLVPGNLLRLLDEIDELIDLNTVDNDAARQHLAILALTGAMPVEQVYRIVTDPAVAEDKSIVAGFERPVFVGVGL